MPTRSEYSTMIWIYEKRREEARIKYGKKAGATIVLTKKIKNWKGQITRIDRRNDKIRFIISTVNYYFNVDISSTCMDTDHKLARRIYYKYAIEDGINGIYLIDFIGRKEPKLAANSRRNFTKTFKTNKSNREAYHNFKFYIKNNS